MASDLELLLMSQYAQLLANGPFCYSVTNISATTATVNLAVPAGYNNIEVIWRVRASDAVTSEAMNLMLNADGGIDYTWQDMQASTSTVTGANAGGGTSHIQVATVAGASASAGYYAAGRFTIIGASDSTDKTVIGTVATPTSSSAGSVGTYSGLWNNTAVVTAIGLTCATGSFVAGSRFSLYVGN